MLCCARRLSAQIGRRDLNRSIHNRSSFPVDAVRKWFATNGARGVFVAREDLGLAARALSDRRRDRIPIVLDNLFLIHFCSSWTANVLRADVESPLLCPAFTHILLKPVLGDTAYIILTSSFQVCDIEHCALTPRETRYTFLSGVC